MKYFHHLAKTFCALAIIFATSFSPQIISAEITADQAKEKVDDRAHLNKYFGQEFGGIGQLIGNDNEAAERKLAALIKAVSEMAPESEDCKALIPRAKSAIEFYQKQIAAAKTPIEEIVEKLTANPDDMEAINVYFTQQNMALQKIIGSDVKKAEAKLTEAKSFVSTLKEKATEEVSKSVYDQGLKNFSQFDTALERSRKMDAMIGQEAAPLAIEAWVNGDAMTAEDLKGKVVLLDFWAVWCGPCIATFPHLKHLQEAYGEKGLVILGLTRYYNYQWNEKAKRATRSQTPVEKTDEQTMLTEFGKSHELNHRFAIQSDNSMSEYYGVTGIPHVVLLDREGKVQLMRVGSGPQNSMDVEDKIKELL
jgi:thiol-disulfide isomerase/thioredoxin